MSKDPDLCCPICKEPDQKPDALVPNKAIRASCARFVSENPEFAPSVHEPAAAQGPATIPDSMIGMPPQVIRTYLDNKCKQDKGGSQAQDNLPQQAHSSFPHQEHGRDSGVGTLPPQPTPLSSQQQPSAWQQVPPVQHLTNLPPTQPPFVQAAMHGVNPMAPNVGPNPYMMPPMWPDMRMSMGANMGLQNIPPSFGAPPDPPRRARSPVRRSRPARSAQDSRTYRNRRYCTEYRDDYRERRHMPYRRR